MKQPFRIGVITNSTTSPSYRDLLRSAENLGVVFQQIAVPYLELSTFSTCDFVRACLDFDAVYYRTGLRDTALDHLTQILYEAGIPLINGSKHAGSHRKIQQALIAEQHHIPQPQSISMTKPSYQTLEKLLGSSFVAKPDFASHGAGVCLIHSEEDLTALTTTSTRDRYIFQEYITGADEYRVYTLGTNYVASYKKIPAVSDFRANLHAGGSMVETEPDRMALLADFAHRVTTAFQADISGLDVFVKDNQCLFIEINWQPGWENLDLLTGKDYSDETIRYIMTQSRKLLD